MRNRVSAIFDKHRANPESQDKAESHFNYGVYNALYGALNTDPKKVDQLPPDFSVEKFANKLRGLASENSHQSWRYATFKEGMPWASQVSEKAATLLKRLGYEPPKPWTDEGRANVSKWLAEAGLQLHGTRADYPAIRMINPARGNVVVKRIEEPTEEGVRKAVAEAKKELGIRDKATATRMRVERED